MKHGAKLGAELGTAATAAGSELVVEKIVEGGRLDAWNRGRPDKAVMPGDRIVQVNGRKGSSETLMSVLESMHSEDHLEFVMRRGDAIAAKPTFSPSSAARLQRGGVALPSPLGQEWTITPMKHGAKLGAELGTMSSELFVVKITDGGRLEAWNRERPDKAVKPGDRIVQVNGRTGGSEALISILRSMSKEEELEF